MFNKILFSYEKDYVFYAHFANEITLPLHTRLTDEEIEYIISNYIEFITSVTKPFVPTLPSSVVIIKFLAFTFSNP